MNSWRKSSDFEPECFFIDVNDEDTYKPGIACQDIQHSRIIEIIREAGWVIIVIPNSFRDLLS
ncbi:MAG: hypothetical protein H8D23_03135 [Candidatus Brocadiales bacterium]|nr:hypothetical protein [Candidatus Brocadiales bacterium]